MSAHGLTLEQVEQLRDAIVENRREFGVKSCTPVPNPEIKGEWGLTIVYEFGPDGKREQSQITAFEDYKIHGIMQSLYGRAEK